MALETSEHLFAHFVLVVAAGMVKAVEVGAVVAAVAMAEVMVISIASSLVSPIEEAEAIMISLFCLGWVIFFL